MNVKGLINELWVKISRADKRLLAVIAINLLFCSFFFYYNLHTGYFVDDYGYMFRFSLGEKITADRISSLRDVVLSQYAHYFIMNGRTVAHTLLQLVLMGGNVLFALFNTVMFLGLALGIYSLAKPTGRHAPVVQAAAYLLPWLCYPEYGVVYLLKCVAANYLWTMTIIIAFLVPFKRLLDGCDIFSRRKYAGAAAMALGGIVAGWCSENGSAGMLFAIGCLGLYYIIARKKIPLWCFTGFGGALLGFAIMLMAPGYRVRVEQETSGTAGLSIFNRVRNMIICHLDHYFWLILAVLLLALWLCLTDKKSKKDRLLYLGGVPAAAAVCGGVLWLAGLALSSSKRYIAILANMKLAMLVCVLAAIVYYVLRSLKAGDNSPFTRLAVPLVMLLTGVMASLAMVTVNRFQTRSEFQFFIFFICGAAAILNMAGEQAAELFEQKRSRQAACAAAAAALLVFSLCSLIGVACKTKANYTNFIARRDYIYEQAATGVSPVTVRAMPDPGDRRVVWVNQANNDPEYWINISMCRYYGAAEMIHER